MVVFTVLEQLCHHSFILFSLIPSPPPLPLPLPSPLPPFFFENHIPKAKRTSAKPRVPSHLVKVDPTNIKEEKKVVKKQVVQDVAIKQLPKIPKLPRLDGYPIAPPHCHWILSLNKFPPAVLHLFFVSVLLLFSSNQENRARPHKNL